ncbi:hypothetical protein FD967_01580 [Polynucleobacter sp. JS-Mosq-20-D10]|uniref:hypothetical protein n=1 Tax=Polynucleobacter sp. JS-Mosq-20-D10 TaxID=2576922 RepID=UPI001BFE6E8F|nr:hypothetical protein [Polynucleobacter sp. JS-Mosq-20-D10]QWE00763.1 hypothetical protein FD967_01580 [Polynucleobacter sp. JS-Mosq-20-D10]
MKHFLVKQINRVNFKTALELFMLLSLLVVWIVWPLRGTIAARNIALVLGAISSIAWLCIERPKFVMMDLLPIGFLLCVPVWLLSLYVFNPIVPYLQWDDLRGTWLRVVIEIIFAIGLGKLYLSRKQYQKFFLWLLYIWPVVILLLFISQGIFTHSWFGEQIYIYVFKSKVAGVYFLIWSLVLCFAMAHWGLIKKIHYKSAIFISTTISNITLVVLFFICIVDYFSLLSLNGFIVIFSGLTFFVYLVLLHGKQQLSGGRYFPGIRFFILTGFVAFALTVVTYDMKYSSGKLANLVTDINFIVNDDTTGAWKYGGGEYHGIYPPINTISSTQVNSSTYERVAWGLAGLKFLKSHPFGLGYTGQAFSYYMAKNYPGSVATKTHSGWLDFALGAGLIGLLFVWAAMGVIFWRAMIVIKDAIILDPMPIYIGWSISILMLLWFIAELSDREYIEHFTFMLTFFSISVGIQKPLAQKM